MLALPRPEAPLFDSIINYPFMTKSKIDRLINPTFHLGVIADASINAGPEPFLDPLDLAHIRRRRVTLSLATHDTKLVKRCPLFVHETVRLANIPLHHLSAAEISHISDVGVG